MHPIEVISAWCAIGYLTFYLTKDEYSTNRDLVWTILSGLMGAMMAGLVWLVMSDWANRRYK